ncbi:MAG: glycoside hydrolase family 130 protein [Planctomycetota bacterium]
MRVRNTQHEILFHRYEGNPILTAADWPYPANSVFNPGAVRLAGGETLLLCRVEDRRGHSHFCVARSDDGKGSWRIDPEPTLAPEPQRHPEELWGIEDPRVTHAAELGKYVIVYTAYSWGGPSVGLALTEDFRSFDRCGVVIPPQDKNAALLPRRIGGRWAMVHRPLTPLGGHIWISYSPDLRHWGDHKLILRSRRGAWWDAAKIGIATPLVETDRGWLMIYHGVRTTASGSLYRIGLALFDIENPEACIRRGDTWIFGPEEAYERAGDVDNVVFPCGYTLDGDTLNMYYGAADTSICLASASVRALLDWLDRHGRFDAQTLTAAEQTPPPL